MKYLILSIYDSWYWYSVNINGKNYDADTKQAQEFEIQEYTNFYNFKEWILDKFKDFDLIIICDNGCIDILKDTTKQKLNQWKNLLKIDGGNTKHQVVVDIESILKEVN